MSRLVPIFLTGILILLVAFTFRTESQSESDTIYWIGRLTDDPLSVASSINRAQGDGSQIVNTFVPNFGSTSSAFAINEAGRQLYWANRPNGLIYRANMNGSDAELFYQAKSRVFDLAVSSQLNIACWPAERSISCLDLDNKSSFTIETDGHQVGRISIDSQLQRVYYVSGNANQNAIMSVDLNNGTIETILSDAGDVVEIEFDPVSNALFLDVNGLPRQGDPIVRIDLETLNTDVLLNRTGGPSGIAVDPLRGYLYWHASGEIYRYDLERNEQAFVFDAGSDVSSIQVDVETGQLYWLLSSGIQKLQEDPLESEYILVGFDAPTHAFLKDPFSDRAFWTDLAKVFSTDLVSGDSMFLAESVRNIRDLEYDPSNKILYWADRVGDAIGFTNLENQTSEIIVDLSDLLISPVGLALDSGNQKIYFTGRDNIYSMNLDGSEFDILLKGIGDPEKIEFHSQTMKVYWSDNDNDSIYRANIDGSGMEVVLSDVNVTDFALSDSFLYWSDASQDDLFMARTDLDGENIEMIIRNVSALEIDVD